MTYMHAHNYNHALPLSHFRSCYSFKLCSSRTVYSYLIFNAQSATRSCFVAKDKRSNQIKVCFTGQASQCFWSCMYIIFNASVARIMYKQHGAKSLVHVYASTSLRSFFVAVTSVASLVRSLHEVAEADLIGQSVRRPFCIVRLLGLRTIEEGTAITDDRTDAFIAYVKHLWKLWKPSDYSRKNRNKRQDLLLWQVADGVCVVNPLF